MALSLIANPVELVAVVQESSCFGSSINPGGIGEHKLSNNSTKLELRPMSGGGS